MRGTWTRSVVAAFVAAGCLLASGCGERPITGPVAAVMGAKGEVALVDLERGEVVDSLTMRTWTTDIEADPHNGTFVTAQSGGVGSEADDKMGIIDVRGDRSVRYVKLPRMNPLGVEVTSDGMALVEHGWEEREGIFLSLVDIDSRTVVRSGHVPDNNAPIELIDGIAWSPGVEVPAEVPTLHRLDPTTLASTRVRRESPYAAVLCGGGGRAYGWLRLKDDNGDPAGGLLAAFDSKSGAVEQTATVEFSDGPGPMVYVNGLLVAVDFTGQDITRPGERLLVFDSESLALVRDVPLTGAPSDIAVWGGKVVVANFLSQTLQVIDPVKGTIDKTVELPAMTRLDLQLAVLDG